MKEDLRMLIKEYRKLLQVLEDRHLEERRKNGQNEAYFFGQWSRLGSVICDLQALERKNAQKDNVLF